MTLDHSHRLRKSPRASLLILHCSLVIIHCSLTLVACRALAPAPTPTPTLLPTATATFTPTPEPLDTGWQEMEPGVEVRRVLVPSGDVVEQLTIVRLDPACCRFRVLYTPGTAQQVSQWAAAANPLLVVNGGYFTSENHATGLLVSDGQAYGVSYGSFAGMFAVLPGGRVEVRWLAAQPYAPTETLVEAVQSFPVLVKPGGVMGFPADADDGRSARRTVVAQDEAGHILFIAAPRGYLSLHEMARWLTESDLEIDVALNLDGGFSTGLYLLAGDPRVQIDSLVPVPAVIVVERRE